MDELLKELTLLAKTARAYLEFRFVIESKANGIPLPGKEAPALAEPKKEKAAAPKKEKTASPAKAATTKTITDAIGDLDAPAGKSAKPATPEMSEKESLDACYKLAAKYIGSDDAETKKTRTEALRGHIKEKYNATNIAGLKHEQRVEFFEYLKALDAEAVPA